MNSLDYYKILTGWDVENYLTEGIRYCAIYVKLTESFDDDLLVQYVNGTRRRVAGMYLFTDKSLALAWVEDRRLKEISAINAQIAELFNQIDNVNYAYAQVTIEDAKEALVT